jgi:hypothetical protein
MSISLGHLPAPKMRAQGGAKSSDFRSREGNTNGLSLADKALLDRLWPKSSFYDMKDTFGTRLVRLLRVGAK